MMAMPKYSAQRDANERAILDAITAAGGTYIQLSDTRKAGIPDLCVGIDGETYLIEVKKRGGNLNPEQQWWAQVWKGGAVRVIHGPREFLVMIGRLKPWAKGDAASKGVKGAPG